MSSHHESILVDNESFSKRSKKRSIDVPVEQLIISRPKKKSKPKDESDSHNRKVFIDRKALKIEKEEERRIRGLKLKKSKQDERDAIYAKLAAHAIDDRVMKHLKSSSKIGQTRPTKKEALRRALAEENAGIERSNPNLQLYEERDQVVDFTAHLPLNNLTAKFEEENADLLSSTKREMPKPTRKKNTSKPSNPQRNLKKRLFTVIESSSSDSEGDKKRKALKQKYQNEAEHSSISDIESSLSDIETSGSEDHETSRLGDFTSDRNFQREPAKQESKVEQANNAEATSGFVVPDFSKTINSKSSTSTIPSSPFGSNATSGFVIPIFKSTKESQKPSTATSALRKFNRTKAAEETPVSQWSIQTGKPSNSETESGSDEEESGELTPEEKEEDIRTTNISDDEKEKEMRKRHGLTPVRPAVQFENASFDQLHSSDLMEGAEVINQPAPTAVWRLVTRTPDIVESRSKLPIIMEEHLIMETINKNDFVIICGETGSGKTTQVPQFLYEAGYGDPNSPSPGLIGVTEPRRVAAISTAQRVALELKQEIPTVEGDDRNDQLNKPKPLSHKPHHKSQISPLITRHVGYQVRYDSNIDSQTQIKFMTDGILLREIQGDFLLNKYSAIIIDEAHERTLNTDLLLGLLCKIVPMRNSLYDEQKLSNPASITPSHQIKSKLKVIIMSATLRIADFVENKSMFPNNPPPVIKIAARQFPVSIHFNKLTDANYVEAAFKKVIKIHDKLPPGGILVFLSGQAEIHQLVKRLRNYYHIKLDTDDSYMDQSSSSDNEDDEEGSLQDSDSGGSAMEDINIISNKQSISDIGGNNSDIEDDDMEIELDQKLKPNPIVFTSKPQKSYENGTQNDTYDFKKEDTVNMEEGDGDELESKHTISKSKQRREKLKKLEAKRLQKEIVKSNESVIVIPLYSMLAPRQQMKVFQQVKENCRLIVVSTNIAETSLTIPGISYIVDSGKVKSKSYDKATGMTSYQVTWTSQASADQRAGRAGRTGPGHCYRLFSSAVYQSFQRFSTPDILNIPIEGVVLQMKNMGVHRLDTFPFPTPPDTSSLAIAHQTLLQLGALENEKQDSGGLAVQLQDRSKTKAQLPSGTTVKQGYVMESYWKSVSASPMLSLSITPLGKALVHFPVAPKYAKMLILGRHTDCLPYIIAIVAALAVGDPFEHNLEHSASKQNLWKEWLSNTSDLLVWLSAIGSFEFWSEDEQEEKCAAYHLHFKTMKEIHSLREQLTFIMETEFGVDISKYNQPGKSKKHQQSSYSPDENDIQFTKKTETTENDVSKTSEEDLDAQESNERKKKKQFRHGFVFQGKLNAPPSRQQKLQIRQIISSGLVDRIAKKYPLINEKGEVVHNRFVYKTATILQECQIHPSSFLRSTLPEYVAYNEIIKTGPEQHYLCAVTAVSLGWMPSLAPWLCSKLDDILPSPPPRYDELKDCIMGAVEPCFFYSDWIAPKMMIPVQGLAAYKYFAKCFLEGEICEVMKQLRPFLNGNPDMILKVWTQEKIGALVQPLVDRKIKSRKHLETIWEKNPEFWLSAIALWVDKKRHAQLRSIWPPTSGTPH